MRRTIRCPRHPTNHAPRAISRVLRPPSRWPRHPTNHAPRAIDGTARCRSPDRHTMPSRPPPAPLLDQRQLSRLHWRSRRGLLENDLFIARFFARHEAPLPPPPSPPRHEPTRPRPPARGLCALRELAAHDLPALLLARREPQGAQDTPAARE